MTDQNRKGQKRESGASQDKVGSSREAAGQVGGELDFGVPADRARGSVTEGGREKGPEPGTGPSRSGASGRRTVGVGHPEGSDGSGSGGDLDPDIIGVAGLGGIALNPREHRTEGPDITTIGGSAPFASGPPAKGENELPAGQIGGAPILSGDSLDHSGGDASTTGDENSLQGQ